MQMIIGRHAFQLAGLIVFSGMLAACGGSGASAPSANATDQTPATPVSTAPGSTTQNPPQTPTNHAPTISGAPAASVTSGQAYNFVPAAADADGDRLQFSITSKPSWASFDSATGKLSGVPSSTGSYEEIEISVSDGKAVTKLPQFAIDVSSATATLRNVQVNWQPPLTNTDGSALTDLKGYRIVYGTQTGVYTNSIPVNSTGLATYTIENLQSGKKYYFSMVSVNASGAESDYTKEVVVNLL